MIGTYLHKNEFIVLKKLIEEKNNKQMIVMQ